MKMIYATTKAIMQLMKRCAVGIIARWYTWFDNIARDEVLVLDILLYITDMSRRSNGKK